MDKKTFQLKTHSDMRNSLIVIMMLAFPITLWAQSGQQMNTFNRGVQAIDSLTAATRQFVEKPDAEKKDKLEEAIERYEDQEELLRQSLLDLEFYALEKEVEELLTKYADNREQLKKELVYWKFREQKLQNNEVLSELTLLKEKSQAIKKMFKSKKSYEDPVSIYMAKEEFRKFSTARNKVVEALFSMNNSASKE